MLLHDNDLFYASLEHYFGGIQSFPVKAPQWNFIADRHIQQAQWVFVGFTFLFFDFFSLGILPVSWMYASEIMPLRTRNKGVALGAAAHWLSNFVIVYVTPQAIHSLGYRLYIIWALLNAIFVPITWLFYPETAGRSLEEMDAVFLNEKFGITRTRTPGIKTQTGYDAPATRD